MRAKSFFKHYYLMLAPAFIWLLFFSIIPMFGLVMAFQDFNPGKGFFGSKWIGLDVFKYMFSLSTSYTIFRNTIIIAVLKIIGNLVIPLVFALLLNELKIMGLKRGIQTIVYMPHFLSWVILSGIILDIFSFTGPVNNIVKLMGGKPVLFFAQDDLFRTFVVGSDVWKEFGFNAIIYLAALTGINPNLYESAAIDGAGRFKRLLHITMPGISVTIIMLAILSMGSILNAGFDQIFNMYNPLVYSTGDIIDTWVYRTGLLNLQFSLATAVGLLKSVVGFVFIVSGYFLAHRTTGYRVF